MLKDQKSLLENNKIKNTVNYSKIKSILDIDDEVRMALPQYKGIAQGSPIKLGNQARAKHNEDSLGSLPAIVRSQSINNKALAESKSPKKIQMRGLNKSIDIGSYAANYKNRASQNISQTPGNALNKYILTKKQCINVTLISLNTTAKITHEFVI